MRFSYKNVRSASFWKTSEVSETQFSFDLSPLNDVNHIVVFLTGESSFPVEMGGGVYLGLQENNEYNWYFLGTLTNERPSAIYKVGNLTKGSHIQNGSHPFSNNFAFANQMLPNSVVQAQLGISVEPLVNFPPQPENTHLDASVTDKMTQFTRFAAESLFNYVASFSHDSNTNDPLVPISAIKKWFDIMLQKLSVDNLFWRR